MPTVYKCLQCGGGRFTWLGHRQEPDIWLGALPDVVADSTAYVDSYSCDDCGQLQERLILLGLRVRSKQEWEELWERAQQQG